MELCCVYVVPYVARVQYLLSALPSAVEFEGALGRLPKASITSPRRTLEVSKSEPGHSIEREVERDLSSHQKRRLVFFTIEKVSEGETAVRSAVEQTGIVQRFDHKGLCKVQNTALHLTKTFVVATLYNCNLLCYVKCSTSLLTFKAVAMSLYQSRETERVYCLATAKLQVLVKACAG